MYKQINADEKNIIEDQEKEDFHVNKKYWKSNFEKIPYMYENNCIYLVCLIYNHGLYSDNINETQKICVLKLCETDSEKQYLLKSLEQQFDNYNLLWAEPLLIAKNSNIKKHKSRILNMIKKMYCIKVAYYAKNRFSITNNTIIVKNELVQFIKSYFTNNKFNIIYESNINIDYDEDISTFDNVCDIDKLVILNQKFDGLTSAQITQLQKYY